MSQRFEDKTVLVTGGAGAIGAAAARRFAEEGAHVVVVDRRGEVAEAFAESLRAEGHDALAVETDVSSEQDVSDCVAKVIDRFGSLDIVFNNAGVSGAVAPVHDLSVEDWDDIVRINLRGIFLVLRASLRAMIAAKTKGTIINMSSSMAGWDVLAGGSGYAATKHGVLGLTRIAALDAAPYGIRVNAVCPGVIETTLGVPADDRPAYLEGVQRFTDRIPLRQIGMPEDVAAVVAFLASSDARHVTGTGWLIDGGQTLQSWSNAPSGTAYPKYND